ncbi:insulinase family protein [Opitutaceae bacterium EW11]|nr:insulinase family protein [Opitutaceae bacterium EW11]
MSFRHSLGLSLALAVGTALGLRAAEAPVSVEGFNYVRTVGEISEYTLASNGLQVLLMPEHSAPVLTFMVTYRVGSRNEVTGTTGATHLLEHLMFKGTEKFQRAKGTGIDQLLESCGAEYNATTWLDRTNYFENLASDKLALAVEMEADRMRNLLLLETDRQPEMTVVRNEFERGENSPYESLEKELYAAAYIAHPYHHPTIGWRSDIEKVSIDSLRGFYDTFYWPNNATVSVIGDFKPAEALRIIQRFYGAIPRSPKPIPQVYTEEPEQTGPRRVAVKRSGQLGVVAIAHKVPAATGPDYASLSVLSAILSDGKNSRLYRALTDKNLTTSVRGSLGFNHDPSLHVLFASLAPGAKHQEVETIALQEIERLKKDGATDLEVSTAISKILADSAFQRDGSYAIAGNLNECIAAGDWTTYYSIDDAVKKVTAADVKRVANTYLFDDHSTIGWFIPTAEADAGEAAQATAAPASRFASDFARPCYYRDPALAREPGAPEGSAASSASASQTFAKGVIRENVGGIDLLMYQTGVHDVVTFRGTLPAGKALSPSDNPAIATLVGNMLDKGTTQQDKFAIAQKLESVGATVRFVTTNDTLAILGKCLRKDVPLVVSLIGEMLRSPAFSPEEFVKVKKQLAGGLKRSLESPDSRAMEAFSRAIYAPGHPNRQASVQELLAGIEAAKLEDLKAFHASHYGPAHMILVAVGDLDPAEVKTSVSKAFAGWSGGVPVPSARMLSIPDGAREQTVFMSDKPSVTIVLGQTTGLKYTDPDAQALSIGTAILGSGFTGRLMAHVRDKEGLTYGIGAQIMDNTHNPGDWRIMATFAPALLSKGISSTKRELETWYEKGVTADELERRKSNVVGNFKVGLATTYGLAYELLANAERGLDPSFLDQYPEIINGLTLEQVNGAVRKHLNPAKMVLIEAGSVPGAIPETKK